MRNSVLILVALLMASVSAGAEQFKIPVGEFSELVLNDKLDVVYSTNPDSVGLVAFETKPAYASYIMTECNKGKLKIQISPDAQEVEDLPTVYVYSTFLSKVENWRNGSVTVKEIKPASKITLSTQGNGRITAAGLDATSVSLKVQSGKGFIKVSGKCRSLEEEVECRLTGTGSAYCSPLSKLKIRGIGTGKVYYRGNPEKIEKSGLTTVKAVKDEGDPASVTVEEKTEVKPEPLTTPSVVDDVFEGGEDDDATEGRKPVQRPDAPAINSI